VDAYIDSSVLLRVALGEPGALGSWSRIERPTSSELVRIETLRTIDRARVQGRLDEEDVARLRADLLRTIETFALVALSDIVTARATEPFPTSVGTMGAIHLASAVLARERIPDLHFATHDGQLGLAARAVGFDVLT
jgi:predicted nucleic acid-binding protein